MKTFVCIDSLQIFARHGVLKQETESGNIFEVSVKLEYNFEAAAIADDINLALNYAELTAVVVEAMKQTRKLIETVAFDIRGRVMNRWPDITSGRIEIAKLNPPIPYPTPRTSVVIEW